MAITLSYCLRRYAGVGSYVLPLDPDLPDYRANVDYSEREALANMVTAAAAAALESFKPEVKRFPRQSLDVKSNVRGSGGIREWGSGRSARGDEERLDGTRKRLHATGHVASVEYGRFGGHQKQQQSQLQRRRFFDLPSKFQFRELSARGGRFSWTSSHCPSELVLLVVEGRRQAELLEPLYRDLVQSAAAGGVGEEGVRVGAEVFVAVVSILDMCWVWLGKSRDGGRGGFKLVDIFCASLCRHSKE